MKLPMIYLPEVNWSQILKDFEQADYTRSNLAQSLNIHINTLYAYANGSVPNYQTGATLVELYRVHIGNEIPTKLTSSSSFF